jgi:hypothetical protein
MTNQFLRQDITPRPAERLKAQSSLVRRLVQAQDDGAASRIALALDSTPAASEFLCRLPTSRK